MGVSLYDSTGKQKNMVEVLKEMARKLGVTADGTSKLTEQQEQQYAAMVGGKTQFDTLMKLLSGVSNEYDELHDQLVNSNGALEEMARIMKDNLGGKIDNMKSAIEGSLIEAFKALEPVLENVVEWITDVANWFSSLDDEAQRNIVTIAGVAAATGPLLTVLGQVLIVGGNAVNLFGALKTSGSNNIKMFGLLKKSISLVSGPAGLVALVGMLVAVISKLGDNEEKLSDLQEKWGKFGKVIGRICEHMAGSVQLTIGNIGILISTLGKTIMAVLSGDFKSIDEIWSEGWAKIENNTAIASSNINSESSRGIAMMREMTEIELNNLVGTFDIALKKLPELTADNAGEMAEVFVTRMQGLDADTLTILRGTSDTMAVLFEGIYENMSKEDAQKKFTANLESMAKSGEFTSDKISQDISDAMNLIDKNVMDGSERVKSSAQSMFDGIASISQFGMDSAVSNIVSSINNMSDETIQSLSAMGGHWETLFGGIALTGKDSVADMESYVSGRLKELSETSPQFISEMQTQMDTYFSQINQSGSSNIDELSTNIESDMSSIEKNLDEHTKSGGDKAVQNAKNTKDNVSREFSETASNIKKDIKQGSDSVAQNMDNVNKKVSSTSSQMEQNVKGSMSGANKSMQQEATDMYKGVSTSMHMMEKKSKQSATDMYKGVTTSTRKMSQESREDASHMHNGVRDSASAMSSKARQSASEMYRGVTTSTRKMADAAISDWNRVRNAYSRSISGTITKTTVNRTISTQSKTRNIPVNHDIPSIASLESVYHVRTPDISDFAISSRYYNSNTPESVSLAKTKYNISDKTDIAKTNNLLNQLITLMKNNNSKNGDININIDKFENNREQDIKEIMEEIAFYCKRHNLSIGVFK
ncbi:Phage-related minor tail protein [uncultured Clostridium sp.]|nr:Phage-related minor tail protein [uncultured Clostridium sp.]